MKAAAADASCARKLASAAFVACFALVGMFQTASMVLSLVAAESVFGVFGNLCSSEGVFV